MVTFGWDLCKCCNFKCPYCGIWKEETGSTVMLKPEEWGAIWDKIFDRYGKCHIFVSGGEPSTYPGFYDLIKKLSKKHFPEICTNLSWQVEKLIPEISPENLKIAPTLHPSFMDFEEFFKKAVFVKAYLPDFQIYCVAYPGQIENMRLYSKRLKDEGIKLIPLPLRGDGYLINSEEEKKIIEEISPYRGEKINYQLNKISPKGKLCRAGKDYAVIRVDGAVDRCSQYSGGKCGSITDKNFKLFLEPAPCVKDYCPIESQWINNE